MADACWPMISLANLTLSGHGKVRGGAAVQASLRNDDTDNAAGSYDVGAPTEAAVRPRKRGR